MSYEAIAHARSINFRGTQRPYEEKWLTVPTDCRESAIRSFHDAGYDIRGLQILTQEEANVRTQTQWPKDTLQA